MTMSSSEVMFEQAMQAIEEGQTARARDLFTRLLRNNQNNVTYWLWMSALVETPKEQIFCLQKVLVLEPENAAAKRGLTLLGGLSADAQQIAPVPPQSRNWRKQVHIEEAPLTWRDRLATLSDWQMWATVGAAGLLVMLVLFGSLWGASNALFRPRLTITPIAWTATPTPTETPTETPPAQTFTPTPTPRVVGTRSPLSLLQATYTATPLYVATAHPITEDYRTALRALSEGRFDDYLRHMQQAAIIEPKSPDIFYHIGEAQRFLGNYQQAVQAYNQALQLSANFAPAYLGRALAQQAMNPRQNISSDLQRAIDNDPNLVEAYLLRADVLLRNDNPEGALIDLQTVEALRPDAPLLYLYRAQAALLLNDPETALIAAQRAIELDVTLIPAYLAQGEAHLRLNQPVEAANTLQTYLQFKTDTPDAWLFLGQALYMIGGDLDSARAAFDEALKLDKNNFDALLGRGQIYFDLADYQKAQTDFAAARNLNRRSFAANAGLANTFLAMAKYSDARAQFNTAEPLAQTDSERATVYYGRAQAQEALNRLPEAIAEWEKLLALPIDAYPTEWNIRAQERLQALRPTPTAAP
ncbi:MAG: hypothetical protein OHK0052_27950 [Anaerolineales bacterium]